MGILIRLIIIAILFYMAYMLNEFKQLNSELAAQIASNKSENNCATTQAIALTPQYEGVDGNTVYLKPFIVNIQDGESSRARYLRLKLVLNTFDGSTEKVISLIPEILDSSQSYLRTLSYAELEGKNGTENIKKGVRNAISEKVGSYGVKQVLFQEILLQ